MVRLVIPLGTAPANLVRPMQMGTAAIMVSFLMASAYPVVRVKSLIVGDASETAKVII
jgi:hypothetical protein